MWVQQTSGHSCIVTTNNEQTPPPVHNGSQSEGIASIHTRGRARREDWAARAVNDTFGDCERAGQLRDLARRNPTSERLVQSARLRSLWSDVESLQNAATPLRGDVAYAGVDSRAAGRRGGTDLRWRLRQQRPCSGRRAATPARRRCGGPRSYWGRHWRGRQRRPAAAASRRCARCGLGTTAACRLRKQPTDTPLPSGGATTWMTQEIGKKHFKRLVPLLAQRFRLRPPNSRVPTSIPGPGNISNLWLFYVGNVADTDVVGNFILEFFCLPLHYPPHPTSSFQLCCTFVSSILLAEDENTRGGVCTFQGTASAFALNVDGDLLGGGRGGVVVRPLASHLGGPGSIPGGVSRAFSLMETVPDDAAGRKGSPVSPRAPLHSGTAPYSPHFTIIGSQDLGVKRSPNLLTLGNEFFSGGGGRNKPLNNGTNLSTRSPERDIMDRFNFSSTGLSQMEPDFLWARTKGERNGECPVSRNQRRHSPVIPVVRFEVVLSDFHFFDISVWKNSPSGWQSDWWREGNPAGGEPVFPVALQAASELFRADGLPGVSPIWAGNLVSRRPD
ncbi:hypothetical protein PR048_004660 [Dryococelus australis]|uniref:Uncharacterized protein n=1 Tax=Dryococelus australis TaxID=614101 RepID=A0ABQ9I617_9NEOP|nr:hypothetical protein PR048_004660 [Dryococelus australis]